MTRASVMSWGEVRARLEPDRSVEGKAPMTPEKVVGRFELLSRTDKTVAIVDPLLPWNAPTVGVYDSFGEAMVAAQRMAGLHPGEWTP